MRRKYSTRHQDYRETPLRHADRLANFQRQMTDYALGEAFRGLRQNRRLSQETAAAEVGVSSKAWREWEKHNGPIKAENLRKVADYFEVDDPDVLVTRDFQGIDPMQLGRIETNQHLILRVLAEVFEADLEPELDVEIQHALQQAPPSSVPAAESSGE